MDITLEIMKPISIGLALGWLAHYAAFLLRSSFDAIRSGSEHSSTD